MCRRGHQSKPIEWDERSDEALSSFPLMMMRKITNMKITFFCHLWTRDPRTLPWTINLKWYVGDFVWVQIQDGPWCQYQRPDFGRVLVCGTLIGTQWCSDNNFSCISLIPWFEPRSMMWKYFYDRHDQGWVRSVIKWSTEFRPLIGWDDNRMRSNLKPTKGKFKWRQNEISQFES